MGVRVGVAGEDLAAADVESDGAAVASRMAPKVSASGSG